MNKILITFGLLLVAALIAWLTQEQFPFAGGGKYTPRDELIIISER